MKVLIFYAAYGGGHLSAANGMKEVILKNYPEYEVEMIDCMEYLNKVINYITVTSYEVMAKKLPKLWGMTYKASRKGIIAKISSTTNNMLARKAWQANTKNKPRCYNIYTPILKPDVWLLKKTWEIRPSSTYCYDRL